MKEIGELIKEKNLHLDTINPVLANGFTQVPNFILKNPELSVGAKVAYAMFLSYAWHNDHCFPGQDRLAEDMGMSRSRVTEFVGELEDAGLVSIERRGQGKTNLYTIHFQVKSSKSHSSGPVDKTPRSRRADFWRSAYLLLVVSRLTSFYIRIFRLIIFSHGNVFKKRERRRKTTIKKSPNRATFF